MKHTILPSDNIKYAMDIFVNSISRPIIRLNQIDEHGNVMNCFKSNDSSSRNFINESNSHILISDENTHWELNGHNVKSVNGVDLSDLEEATESELANNILKVKYISAQLDAIIIL